MKAILGLGNPGPRYAQSRHNVGFRVAQQLAQRWSIPLKAVICQTRVGQGMVQGHPVKLGIPQTMMNASGEAVGCLVKRWRLDPASLLVVCDDASLPLGTIRLRGKGSAGGHKGLASVLEVTGTEAIPRLRVGIRTLEVQEDLTGFVLGRFTAPERSILEKTLALAAEACEIWVTDGLACAMNRFNRRGAECPV